MASKPHLDKKNGIGTFKAPGTWCGRSARTCGLVLVECGA